MSNRDVKTQAERAGGGFGAAHEPAGMGNA